ncbi:MULTISPECIES: hypothetical protein [Micrococcaceae]|uniref:TPM domain-containing protein n=1 Tax=Arthrobacter rhombi TaxID=71253 RepID=A0A1R4FH09_9MICC|nr:MULTISPECIES: hypothetical protein [Micrococcaceae]PCC26490.1 hypothetical protein CIK75_02830 [Glutamicibacter sp. BW78]SJM55224.1 hypothetical protein FM101_03910 [Arthrobacter rhombi]
MTAPPRRRPLSVVCAALAGLVLIGTLAGPAAANEAPEPAGPSVLTPDRPGEDEGKLRIPGREAESEHLFLAVVEAAADRVDAEAIVKAVESAQLADGTKVLLAVDQQPTEMKSAAQLVRGSLLFGQSDALADDWVEHGKTDGYVGKGWMAVGVILPERTGDPVDVSIERGRNIELTDHAHLETLTRAGQKAFDAGSYTQGLSELAVAAGTGIKARSNPLPRVLGGVGIVVLAGIGAAVAGGRRRKKEAALQVREQKVVSLRPRIHEVANELRSRGDAPIHRGSAGPVAASVARLTTHLVERTAGEEQAAEEAATDDTATASAILDRLSTQQGALDGMDLLLGAGRPAKQAWQRQIQSHRDRLQDLTEGLDVPGARKLEAAREVVAVLIEHTRALDDVEKDTRRAAKRGRRKPGYDLLDRLEALRIELDAVTGRLAGQAAVAEVELGPKLADTGTAGKGQPGAHDVLAQLARAVDLLAAAGSRSTPASGRRA